MAYRGAVIEQLWTPDEVKTYCKEKFESKILPYLRNQKKKDRPVRTVNSNGNLSKAQYMRFMEKGLSDEHILAKYQDLTPERLEAAKKRWGLIKSSEANAPEWSTCKNRGVITVDNINYT
ncbi:hypothetical protein [Domibacillus iocasae]|uniref:Uncharacterized protein n=1 Tax=Domibacillus iocasae TaxID=1714016 RepID=A0A1E7DSU2_9BACI|nr:hypothetical protein [Domibacillus iocasae]OES46153.1 hypothetical protein BA724_16390 [Domibacillus iocasae]